MARGARRLGPGRGGGWPGRGAAGDVGPAGGPRDGRDLRPDRRRGLPARPRQLRARRVVVPNPAGDRASPVPEPAGARHVAGAAGAAGRAAVPGGGAVAPGRRGARPGRGVGGRGVARRPGAGRGPRVSPRRRDRPARRPDRPPARRAAAGDRARRGAPAHPGGRQARRSPRRVAAHHRQGRPEPRSAPAHPVGGDELEPRAPRRRRARPAPAAGGVPGGLHPRDGGDGVLVGGPRRGRRAGRALGAGGALAREGRSVGTGAPLLVDRVGAGVCGQAARRGGRDGGDGGASPGCGGRADVRRGASAGRAGSAGLARPARARGRQRRGDRRGCPRPWGGGRRRDPPGHRPLAGPQGARARGPVPPVARGPARRGGSMLRTTSSRWA